MSTSLILNGQIEEGLDTDIIALNQKNMSNWTVTGGGSATVTYNSDSINNNISFTTTGLIGQDLIDMVYEEQGYQFANNPSNLEIFNAIVSEWRIKGDDLHVCIDRLSYNKITFVIPSQNSTVENRPDDHGVTVNGGNLYPLTFYEYDLTNESWSNYEVGSGWAFYDNQTNAYHNYGKYSENIGTSIKDISCNITTSGKNTIYFESRSVAGFTTNMVKLIATYEVSGVETTSEVVIDGTAGNDYKKYSLVTSEVDNQITLTCNITCNTNITFDIKDIKCYRLG